VIITNSKRLTGTVNWEDILKLYKTKKTDCAILPAAQCDAQASETWLTEYDEIELG
jgi:hypothetical protein